MVFGTPAFRVDLVDAAINFKPTIVSRGFKGVPFFSFPRPNKGSNVLVRATTTLLTQERGTIPNEPDPDDKRYVLTQLCPPGN